MCLQCTTAPVYFGEPFPGWVLARSRVQDCDWPLGFWGLIDGHDNPAFVWELTPTPSPTWGMTAAEEGAWWEDPTTSAADRVREAVMLDDPVGVAFRQVFAQSSIRVGYRLIAAAVQSGYDPNVAFDFWLLDYLGEYLRTAPAKFDEDFDRAFVAAGGVIDASIGSDPYTPPPPQISAWPSKHRPIARS